MNQAPDHAKLLAQAVDIYEFRAAVPGDIDALIGLYTIFFAESGYGERGLTFDPKGAWVWLFNGISTGNLPHLVAIVRSSGELIGAVSYLLDSRYTTEPIAHLNQIYVRKQWRRSAVGRVLATLALEVARADGAVCFDALLDAGMERETASLRNMFLKLGFRDAGSKQLIRSF